jgi:phosphatidylserine decarboxylase
MAELRIPGPLRGPLVRTFARMVGADLSEASLAPERYASISAFFTRELREGVREWPDDPDVAASPVDGIVGASGSIQSGTALQAKGMPYSIAALLGSEQSAGCYEGGAYLTLYLSPRHYHRIHAPVAGWVHEVRAVPGALLPVNLPAVQGVPALFPRNERVVVEMERAGDGARVALVAVGAFNVGRISSIFDPALNVLPGRGISNIGDGSGLREWEYADPREIERGRQLLAFHLGSTVVLLFGSKALASQRLHEGLRLGAEVRLGAPMFE